MRLRWLFAFTMLALLSSCADPGASGGAPEYRAEYRVYGPCKMLATYYAQGEALQQDYVYDGWWYKFNPSIDDFLYISAQKQCEQGTVRVELYEGGRLVKRASSTAAYGIATVHDSY